MRTFDLAPLYRSTVGFDRLFSMLDGFEAAPGYPPYNIERTGENDYRISVAVAGFGESELSIESEGKHADHQGREAGQGREQRRGALPGHRGARLRAPVPACRLRPGEGRVAGERSPARRSRARDPRGEEAAPDRHQRQWQAAGRRDQGCGLTPELSGSSAEWSAPEAPGALLFCRIGVRAGILAGAGDSALRSGAGWPLRRGCGRRRRRSGAAALPAWASAAARSSAALQRRASPAWAGDAGAARCGKRSGGGGSMPPCGSAVDHAADPTDGETSASSSRWPASSRSPTAALHCRCAAATPAPAGGRHRPVAAVHRRRHRRSARPGR